MTIRNAIDHFTYKFKNVWKPTSPDIDALNTIIKFVQDKHKRQINDYQLFAKLYVMVYAQYLERYKTTIFDDIPRKELHKLLDTPLEAFIQRFTDRLNESERYSLFDDLKITDEHPATKSQELKDKETDVLEHAIKNKDNLDRYNAAVWDYDTVKENIELQINNVINAFK